MMENIPEPSLPKQKKTSPRSVGEKQIIARVFKCLARDRPRLKDELVDLCSDYTGVPKSCIYRILREEKLFGEVQKPGKSSGRRKIDKSQTLKPLPARTILPECQDQNSSTSAEPGQEFSINIEGGASHSSQTIKPLPAGTIFLQECLEQYSSASADPGQESLIKIEGASHSIEPKCVKTTNKVYYRLCLKSAEDPKEVDQTGVHNEVDSYSSSSSKRSKLHNTYEETLKSTMSSAEEMVIKFEANEEFGLTDANIMKIESDYDYPGLVKSELTYDERIDNMGNNGTTI